LIVASACTTNTTPIVPTILRAVRCSASRAAMRSNIRPTSGPRMKTLTIAAGSQSTSLSMWSQ
jgi:hypothetical protein